jgi:hypothetical protein
MNALPSIVSFFSIACGISMITLAALVQAPLPEDNLKAYRACSRLHPQKYCAITHAPSKVRTMGKN